MPNERLDFNFAPPAKKGAVLLIIVANLDTEFIFGSIADEVPLGGTGKYLNAEFSPDPIIERENILHVTPDLNGDYDSSLLMKVREKLQDIVRNTRITLLFVIRQDNAISKKVAETLLEGYHDERWIIDIPIFSSTDLPQGTLSAALSLLHVVSVSEATQAILSFATFCT